MKEKFFTWKPDKFWFDAFKTIIIAAILAAMCLVFAYILYGKETPEIIVLLSAFIFLIGETGAVFIILFGLIKQIIKEWKR